MKLLPAWWPTAVAGLLLASGGGWLFCALPRAPGAPLASRAASETAPNPIGVVPDWSVPAAVTEEPPTAEDSGCRARPLRFSRLSRGPQIHRYTGLLGREPITVELRWTRPDSITGRFYCWRRGPEYQLYHAGRRQGSLVFSLHQAYSERPGGTWHLAGLPGPLLHGAWLDAAGRRQAFTLRENYRTGVRYEVQSLELLGGQPSTDCGCREPSYAQDYLHLLGPGLPPLVRHRLCPPLAQRRQLLRKQLRQRYAVEGTMSYNLDVQLNDFQLLSYATYYTAYACGGGRQEEVSGTLLDLRTGQVCPLAAQFIPHYWRRLRALVARHLQHDARFDFVNKDQMYTWRWAVSPRRPATQPDTAFNTEWWTQRELAPLTNQLVLTAEGLELTYSMGSLAAASVEPDQTVLIPYRELRPLVRPGTPLARMLAARGLW